ncbi:MAG: nuclear transport factor 2 family protein [Halobacteriales archaeon]
MAEDELTHEGMERTMRSYFEACNDGDVERIASFFVEGGVHYFPPGMYGGPFVGGRTIGERWAAAVEELGSIWTVDSVMTDPDTARAAMEWTHFKTADGTVLRGDEWYEFDPDTGLIEEIRAYYASPQDDSLDRLELGGFDYEGRDYPVEPPFTRG